MAAPKRRLTRATLALAAACILLGLGLNVWFFTWLAPDGTIESGVIRGLIWATDAALILTGLALIRLRPRVRARDLSLVAGSVLFVLLVLEGAFRLGLGTQRMRTLRPDPELGWAVRESVDYVRTGDPVYGDVRYTTDPRGFRTFGDVEADATRIFFVGDSNTQAAQVSDGEPYYDWIAEARPDVEAFAYSAGGWGTLQEHMILDRFIDEIRPDVVVVQLTPNDVMNNTWALESRSAFNSRMTRPYREDGEIAHRFPSRHPPVQYSKLTRFVAMRLDFLGQENCRFRPRSVEYHVDRYRDLWDDAIDTTVEILRLMKDRVGEAPLVAFEVTLSHLYGSSLFPSVCRRAGIPLIDRVRPALDSAEAAGTPVDFSPRDAHWNADGHAIAGRVILEALMDLEMLPSLADAEDEA